MIDKQLNEGDYIFTAKGDLARITKVNKTTYSFVSCANSYRKGTISFNGITKNPFCVEWFHCDEPTAKALKLAYKRWLISEKQKNALEANEELIGKAKYFLSQIEDIEEIEPEELE